jgi:hypothetical protein
MSYQILVVHNVADFSHTLRNVADYLKCFERYGPPAQYIYHRITDPVTPALLDIRFHAVIFDSSALGACRFRPRSLWEEHKARWSFLADVDAVKMAFPQDDYHESNTLDALFDDFRFDVVYTVIAQDPQRLYPRSSRRAKLITVLTGYVDDGSIERFARHSRLFARRRVDLGQRVTMYSPLGGRYARLKGELAQRAANAARARGMRVDVSLDESDKITGDRWFSFLGDCRYVTGCEGGVSVWDPDGHIYDRVQAYTAAHSSASFEEVEHACFPGEDGRHVFSAVSPRLFEAALMRCCQIQVEAPYLGVLKPFTHYIPVAPDLSNIGEALDLARDQAGAHARIENTYDALVATREFRYSTLAQRVFAKIDSIVTHRHVAGTPPERFESLRRRHFAELRRARRAMAPSLGRRALGLLRRGGAKLVPSALHPYVKQWIDR